MITRQEVTHKVLALLEPCDITVHQAMTSWWVGSPDTQSLQLTYVGSSLLKKYLEHWIIDLGTLTITPKRIVNLGRLACPWFLSRAQNQHQVMLYGGTQATWAKLYHDPELWINSLGS
jgi:hypothetical protein